MCVRDEASERERDSEREREREKKKRERREYWYRTTRRQHCYLTKMR